MVKIKIGYFFLLMTAFSLSVGEFFEVKEDWINIIIYSPGALSLLIFIHWMLGDVIINKHMNNKALWILSMIFLFPPLMSIIYFLTIYKRTILLDEPECSNNTLKKDAQ